MTQYLNEFKHGKDNRNFSFCEILNKLSIINGGNISRLPYVIQLSTQPASVLRLTTYSSVLNNNNNNNNIILRDESKVLGALEWFHVQKIMHLKLKLQDT